MVSMALSLRERRKARHARIRAEFHEIIDHLLENDQVRRLDAYKQHFQYTRLRHSMDVSYNSYRLAKLLGLDCRSVARAGLLHDLFFHREGQNSRSLLFSHPRIALENARTVCSLNAMEEDIILKHMFLLTPWLPRYRESYVVTLVDKYCAAREFLVSAFTRRQVRAVYPR